MVLKGPHRGWPLTAAGLGQVLQDDRIRAGSTHATCHELRHTCFARIREAEMAFEAIQAHGGHASIETTRIYLHRPAAGTPGSISEPWPSSTTGDDEGANG